MPTLSPDHLLSLLQGLNPLVVGPWPALGVALQVLALMVGSTFVFDGIHWLLHVFAESKSALLRFVGDFHEAHHRFLDTALRVQPAHVWPNIFKHVIPEFGTRVLITSLGFLFAHPLAVIIALIIPTIQLVVVLFNRGLDSNHVPYEVLGAPLEGGFVGPRYHAMHHLFPLAYFGSMTTLFDKLFGTGVWVRGRRVAITGASGSFGEPFAAILEAEGAIVTRLKFGRDYSYDDYSRLDAVLAETDILVLCHGAKVEQAQQANCDSYVAMIERLRTLSKDRRFPPEVWASGSEIEAHPSWGNAELEIYLQSKRAFARHARRYFHEQDLLYRHIVASAFTSRMGKGFISGRLAARWAWFFIKRGFRYIPVSYTGIALLNFPKFLLRWHAVPPHPAARRYE